MPAAARGAGQRGLQQAGVEARPQRWLVQARADENQLLATITVPWVPVRTLVRPLSVTRGPLLSRQRRPPRARSVDVAHAPRLPPLIGHTVSGGHPEEALGAQHSEPGLWIVEEGPQPLRVEGLWPAIDEAADAVRLRLRSVVPSQLALPARGRRRLLVVEQPCTDHALDRHTSPSGAKHAGAGVERAHRPFQGAQRTLVDQIALVQDDDVGKLHLVDQQIGHRALILLVPGGVSLGERIGALVLR